MSRCRGFWLGGLVALFPLMAIGFVMPTRSVAGQEVGEVFRDCDVCPEMVVVPAGSFKMGSPETEEGRWGDEGPQHQVTIDYEFAAGVYEISYDEWEACVQAGGCGGYVPEESRWGRGTRPVSEVSWDDAWLYVDWLTDQTREQYRLLSEAEWEYVARARTRTKWYWGESELDQCRYANGYDASAFAELGIEWEMVGCRDRQTYPASVGSYLPNDFGLYDVLGNVSEWVDDCWNGSYESAPTDGSPWYTGDCTRRVHRGGDYTDDPADLRLAYRNGRSSDFRISYTGFRVARAVR